MRKIKILWFYQYAPDYDFDNHFHMLFARYIQQKDDTFDLMAYGRNLRNGYPDITPIGYNPATTLEQLRKHFAFDVIICNTKSRMFENYSPPRYPYKEEIRINQWLPKDFRTSNIPKIMIDEDTHYENDDNWYVEEKFDLLLQRHYANALKFQEISKIETLWHPFSVDINSFKPNGSTRKNKVCFSGNSTHEIYIHRLGAKQELHKAGLIDTYEANKKGQDYINLMKEYVCYLCGSSIYNITPAKIFEIISSGGILLTNDNDKYGIEKIFPKDLYITYKEDYTDVVFKAREILKNKALQTYMSNIGRKHIVENHSHEVRLRELDKILRDRFNL